MGGGKRSNIGAEEVYYTGHGGDDGEEALKFPVKGLVVVGKACKPGTGVGHDRAFKPGTGVGLGAVELIAHSVKEEERSNGVVLRGGVFVHDVLLRVPFKRDVLFGRGRSGAVGDQRGTRGRAGVGVEEGVGANGGL